MDCDCYIAMFSLSLFASKILHNRPQNSVSQLICQMSREVVNDLPKYKFVLTPLKLFMHLKVTLLTRLLIFCSSIVNDDK